MIEAVARALGAELLGRVAFVGGCATGLLVTDEMTRQDVRYTQDVDLIVEVVTYGEWAKLQQELLRRGFRPSPEDDIVCRMRLRGLIVDFMPTHERVLGFGSRWYELALKTADAYALKDDLTIRLVTPSLFVATKLDAYRGRGNEDPLSSRDIEDLINLFDGRDDIVAQIARAATDVRTYIAGQIAQLLESRDFGYAVQGNVQDAPRRALVLDRLRTVASLGVE
jgi:predicted nucleotidyltransferase